MSEPEKLVKLSLEAIGKYFCDLWDNFYPYFFLITKRNRSEEEEQTLSVNVQKLKFTCRHFHCLLTENLPITLANKVTNKLLSCIDSVESFGDENELEEEMYEELIKCVIHPAVTRIAPKMDFLDCSDTFPQNEFSKSILVKVLMKNVKYLTKLKSLNFRNSYRQFDLTDIEFPPFLEEFSAFCNDESLTKIATSCRYIKSLILYGAKYITDSSVATILQMENLEKLNIARTHITIEGNINLLTGLIKKGETSKLKYLSLSQINIKILSILKDLPSLKIGLQDLINLHGLSDLNNLYGVYINVPLRYFSDIYKDIGRHLVFLDISIDTFSRSDIVNDVLLIGQHFTSLRCFHFSCKVDMFLSLEGYMRHAPVFQTVTCLKVYVIPYRKMSYPHDVFDYHYPCEDLLYFLISQCVNVKKLTIKSYLHCFDKYQFINNVIQAQCIKNLEELYFVNLCKFNDTRRENEVVQELVDHCPKLRIVGGLCGFNESHIHNCQKLKFIKNTSDIFFSN